MPSVVMQSVLAPNNFNFNFLKGPVRFKENSRRGNIVIKQVIRKYKTIDIERQKIDCLMTCTACLVCFISTVNDRNKKERKEDYYERR
jgi:hypothetical protein